MSYNRSTYVAVSVFFAVAAMASSAAFALPGTSASAGDASMSPIRLNAAKIPGCSKAYVCNDLQYGGRQLGKGTKDANSAQTYDLYLPGNVGEIDRDAPFFLFVHGGAWKRGSKAGRYVKLFAEMAEQGFAVASPRRTT